MVVSVECVRWPSTSSLLFAIITSAHNAEPDGYSATVPAPQLAKDFEFLKTLVAEKSPATQFIAGPDVASVNQYFVR